MYTWVPAPHASTGQAIGCQHKQCRVQPNGCQHKVGEHKQTHHPVEMERKASRQVHTKTASFVLYIREGLHSSEFGQNCGYFQLVFVNTSGFHVRPPSDHLSQICLMDQKDQMSCSVWVWSTNFAKIAFKQTNPLANGIATKSINKTKEPIDI